MAVPFRRRHSEASFFHGPTRLKWGKRYVSLYLANLQLLFYYQNVVGMVLCGISLHSLQLVLDYPQCSLTLLQIKPYAMPCRRFIIVQFIIAKKGQVMIK